MTGPEFHPPLLVSRPGSGASATTPRILTGFATSVAENLSRFRAGTQIMALLITILTTATHLI